MKIVVRNPWVIFHAENSMRVSEFFDFYRISQKKRRQMINLQHFLVNGIAATMETLINKNDRISILAFDEDCNDELSRRSCDVVYEDDFVLVVNKPAGIIIHGDGTELKETLDQQVRQYYRETFQNCSVRHLHRLDEMTSGCVLYSKCSFFQPFLDFLLSEKKIHREYIAVVKGIVPWNEKRIDLPIGKDRHHNQRQRIFKNGKPAVTKVTVLKRCRSKNTTLIFCELETGRTHQIRVHMSSLGYPLLNDDLYGEKKAGMNQMALHAYRITWLHPLTLKKTTVCAPIPDEIKNEVDNFEI